MRRNKGLTLLELLITLFSTAILLAALAISVTAGSSWVERAPERYRDNQKRHQFEDQMRRLIEGAWLSPDAEDQATYLYGVDSSGSGGFADTLVITAVGQPANGGYLNEPEPEFEDLNDRFGPQGGLSEIMVSTLPVGDAPPVSGVFVRTQRPADGDPSQGGYESLLTEDVSDLRFEFFDGLDWQTEWDTVELIRRLPSAVRVIYTLAEEQFERTFVVGLIHSDVTPDDPAVLETEEALQP